MVGEPSHVLVSSRGVLLCLIEIETSSILSCSEAKELFPFSMVYYLKEKMEEVKDHFQILLKNNGNSLFLTHKYKSYLISD